MPKSSSTSVASQSSIDKVAGRKANLNGKNFEDVVEQNLIERGFVYWNMKGTPPENWYTRQFNAGNKLCGARHRVDFMVDGYLLIECKWQSSGGSVDEKYPWTMMNLAHTGLQSIMVLEGGGCRPGMVKFLEEFADKTELITLCDLDGFYKIQF